MKHKHYDLIMQYCKHPASYVVECQSSDFHDVWYTVINPAWHPNCNYRLVPKVQPTDVIKFGELSNNVRFRFQDKAMDIAYGECITVEVPAEYWPNWKAIRSERLFYKSQSSFAISKVPASTPVRLCHDPAR